MEFIAFDNMLNFFNNKKTKDDQGESVEEKDGKQENDVKSGQQKPEEEKITVSEGITIHVMPERFRFAQVKVSKAKTTGLFIIIGGAVFLVIITALLLFYLFRQQPLAPQSSQEGKQAEKTGTTEQRTETQAISDGDGQKEVVEVKARGSIEQESAVNPETKTKISPKPSLPIDEADQATTTILASEDEAISTSTPIGLSKGIDSDGDGLTDKEEALLGCSSESIDSDGDGYDDLHEIMNLYNPNGADRLINNSNINKYLNYTFAYSLLYPNSWKQSTVGGDDSLMFKSSDNQFIQVIVQPNADQEPIEDWYNKQFGQATIDNSKKVAGVGWQGIRSEDDLTIYLTDKEYNYIFVITYNYSSSNSLDYVNIFEMMVRSFVVEE